jgi:hypothetical protein
MQIFRLSRHHLAEGVEFPEKNAGSGVFEPSFGGGDPPVGSCHPILAIQGASKSFRITSEIFPTPRKPASLVTNKAQPASNAVAA